MDRARARHARGHKFESCTAHYLAPTTDDIKRAFFLPGKWKERFAGRNREIADRFRAKLGELYGEEKGRKVKYAEAFELCDYGRQASREELRKLCIVD